MKNLIHGKLQSLLKTHLQLKHAYYDVCLSGKREYCSVAGEKYEDKIIYTEDEFLLTNEAKYFIEIVLMVYLTVPHLC